LSAGEARVGNVEQLGRTWRRRKRVRVSDLRNVILVDYRSSGAHGAVSETVRRARVVVARSNVGQRKLQESFEMPTRRKID
jgi:hypothetical protein